MGSLGAMIQGSKERYRQGKVTRAGKLVPEGVEGRVPYRGPLGPFVYQLVGGLKAGMGYCGTRNIEELRTKTTLFRRRVPLGVRRVTPMTSFITQEAPNYSTEFSGTANSESSHCFRGMRGICLTGAFVFEGLFSNVAPARGSSLGPTPESAASVALPLVDRGDPCFLSNRRSPGAAAETPCSIRQPEGSESHDTNFFRGGTRAKSCLL